MFMKVFRDLFKFTAAIACADLDVNSKECLNRYNLITIYHPTATSFLHIIKLVDNVGI